jgi:hypothetical protein
MLLSAVADAATASPGTTYEFKCTGSKSSTLSLTLVSFNFPVTTVTGSSGRVPKLGPLTIVFEANSMVPQMYEELFQGNLFQSCSLFEKVVAPAGAAGTTSTAYYLWDFALVLPTGLNAIGTNSSNTDSAGANAPTALMQATFEIGAAQMKAGT